MRSFPCFADESTDKKYLSKELANNYVIPGYKKREDLNLLNSRKCTCVDSKGEPFSRNLHSMLAFY
jgi:hypothetical protein